MGGEGRAGYVLHSFITDNEESECRIGLQRVRDNLMEQLHELNKTKPRGKESEILVAEITRLESSLAVARDDQVRFQVGNAEMVDSKLVL